MDWWAYKPIRDRSLRDDVIGALFGLLGAAVAWLVFGAHDPGILVATAAGLVIGVAGINVVRRRATRRHTQ